MLNFCDSWEPPALEFSYRAVGANHLKQPRRGGSDSVLGVLCRWLSTKAPHLIHAEKNQYVSKSESVDSVTEVEI